MLMTLICISEWALLENKIIINLNKTVEKVFHRPNPKLCVYPAHIEGKEKVSDGSLLGILLKD